MEVVVQITNQLHVSSMNLLLRINPRGISSSCHPIMHVSVLHSFCVCVFLKEPIFLTYSLTQVFFHFCLYFFKGGCRFRKLCGIDWTIFYAYTPLLMCSECVSLSVNFYRKSEGVRMRGHETSSSAQRDVHEFLSFSHRKWMLLD